MYEKKVIQLSEEAFTISLKSAETFGYQQGTKDALRGMGLGIVIVGAAGLIAIIADSIVEKWKHRKQTKEAEKDVSK